jgi:transposase
LVSTIKQHWYGKIFHSINIKIIAIDAEDWEKTPVSVRKLVVQLGLKIEQLEKQLKELQGTNQKLEEKVNRNSHNSHSPPSSDPPKFQTKKKKKKPGKKRGGQPGHRGHSRPLYPLEECQFLTDHYPPGLHNAFFFG